MRRHDGSDAMRQNTYQVAPYPKLRRMLAAMYDVVQRTHKVHGLIEVDVTEARRYLREREAQAGERLSFSAFIIACVAHAVDENKSLNVCRKGGKRLALFEDVDVATAIERDMTGQRQPIIYSVRAANRKTVREIHRDIRTAQAAPVKSTWEGFQAERWLKPIPMTALRAVWSIFWWARGRYPRIQKKYGGTIGLTAVGMFGDGGGWGIPLSYHTLDVTLGGIAQKPGVVAGRIAIREYLCVTLSFDHDVIDGAPAARFVSRLRELIESGYGLREGEEPPVTDGADRAQVLPAR
ncbi:MAG TPA: 2-oxo acid dehydrogenase subunit E2 [Ktedonobacterales bacterium]|nr:2-oxo acid dehydrogenase subunit E2 [Ktedonobacterales bacterium]